MVNSFTSDRLNTTYGASFTGDYLRYKTRSNKVKACCFMLTFAVNIEQTLSRATTTRNSTKPVDLWILYLRPWMDGSSTSLSYTLSGDQNEVLQYQALQSLLLPANFRISNRQNIFFFFFSIWLQLTWLVLNLSKHYKVSRSINVFFLFVFCFCFCFVCCLLFCFCFCFSFSFCFFSFCSLAWFNILLHFIEIWCHWKFTLKLLTEGKN